MHRGRALFVTALAFLFFHLGGCATGGDLTPVISSEDSELDAGGADIEPLEFDDCPLILPKLYTLDVSAVENGTLTQMGTNAPDNPAILDIGNIYGPDPNEPLTRLNLEFITDSVNLYVGADPNIFAVLLHLILLDLSDSLEFLTNYVPNEPVYDDQGNWIGNKIASWDDPLPLFDGLLNLNETYILQSCRGVVLDQLGHQIIGRSQPLYIQARLTGT